GCTAVPAPAPPPYTTLLRSSATQINLTWTDNATSDAGTHIERSTDGTTFTQIATAGPASSNYLDSGLASGTTYYYRVAASNASGSSAYSNTANATIPSTVVLEEPRGLAASVASAGKINLT